MFNCILCKNTGIVNPPSLEPSPLLDEETLNALFGPGSEITLEEERFNELKSLKEDRSRALKLAYELTLECQTCTEAVADLIRQVKEARSQRDELQRQLNGR